MPILALKLVLTPVLIGLSGLVARRWGPSVGGWLIALPLTSGPVLFFLAIEVGPTFAASVAVGALAGLAAIAAFCVAYPAVGPRGPHVAVLVASAVYVAAGIALQPVLATSLVVVLGVVLVAIVVALRALPPVAVRARAHRHPRWELPGRMALGTVLVLAITGLASSLGPGWTGVLATYPLYLAILTAFTHHGAGLPAGIDVLRGLLLGLFGTAGCFVVLSLGLDTIGIAPAFALALAVALGLEAVTLPRVRAVGAPVIEDPPGT